MEWIDIRLNQPDLNRSVLVAAKMGSYWKEVHGEKDCRPFSMYVGYFYDFNDGFRKLKPKIEFKVECGCSGPEYDKEELEVLFWMELPKLPEEL